MRKRRTKAITAAVKESQKVEEKPVEEVDLSDFMNKPAGTLSEDISEEKAKNSSTKISSVQIEIFETTVSLDAVKKAVRKSVKEKGLSGNIEIYLNAEERAAYYTVNGNGSPEYRIDLKTL